MIPLAKSVVTNEKINVDRNLTLNTTVTTLVTQSVSSPYGEEITVTKVIETHPNEHLADVVT